MSANIHPVCSQHTAHCASQADIHPCSKNGNRCKWLFLGSFVFSCFFFWWLRSILVRDLLHIVDTVTDETIGVSILALLVFIAGYLIPVFTRSAEPRSYHLLDACSAFAYKATLILSFPALLIAIQQLTRRIGVDYGLDDIIPRPYQALLYIHLFFGFMYLGGADPEKQGKRRLVIATILVVLPRLIISLHGARFFLAQAVVPALLIAVARGWIRFSAKRILQILALTIFIGPNKDLEMITGSNVLGLYQDNLAIDLDNNCPPLLISLTAKTIPYGLLGVCVVDFAGLKNMPATLERIITNNDPYSGQGTAAGAGSNYLLELYVTGGLFAVYFGSVLFGYSCRLFVRWIGRRSLFAGIWAECLTRALLAPRGNIGYVFERIPSLVLATSLVIFLVWAGRLVKNENSAALPLVALRSEG
jgi:hypothetical protein